MSIFLIWWKKNTKIILWIFWSETILLVICLRIICKNSGFKIHFNPYLVSNQCISDTIWMVRLHIYRFDKSLNKMIDISVNAFKEFLYYWLNLNLFSFKFSFNWNPFFNSHNSFDSEIRSEFQFKSLSFQLKTNSEKI